MKTLQKWTVIPVILLATARLVPGAPAAEQGLRTYPCHRLEDAVETGGQEAEAAWQCLPEAIGFHRFKRKDFAVRKPTAFRIGWTQDALFLRVRCREPFGGLMAPMTADQEPLWGDDSIELFLLPPGAGEPFQFIANPIGARWQGEGGRGSATLGDWTARAQVGGDEWVLELRIPFSLLGATPAKGDAWRFNVARNLTTGPENERFSTWAPVETEFGEVARFATLTFRGAPAAGETADVERPLNAAYRGFIAEEAAVSRNLVRNGSFEEGLKGWGPSCPEHTVSDPDTATLGDRSIRLEGATNQHHAGQSLKLKPATKYRLRCDIKRSRFAFGSVSVDVLERDSREEGWTFHRCGAVAGRDALPNAWVHHELAFQTSSNLLESMVMLYNVNSNGTTAWYDGIELVEDDGTVEDNDAGGLPRAAAVLPVELETRDAVVTLLVNGKEAAVAAGKPSSVRFREGLNVVGIEARAAGPNPGVKARIAGDPLTDTRWRAAAGQHEGWQDRDFDDASWPLAAPSQGWLWATNGAERVLFRQVVLWNRSHDGPDRCLHPLLREWGISEGSMENLYLLLYSHLPFALEDYEFVLEVPEAFRLMDITNRIPLRLNVLPAGIAVETAERDGRPYTRYRISQHRANVGPDRIMGQFLPLFLEKWPGPGRETAWHYRRLARGNITELEQKVPVRILPPIHGGFCRKILLSQYCTEYPYAPQKFATEHFQQHLRQSLQAGFNTWHRPSSNTTAAVLKAGGRICLGGNYPFYGLKSSRVPSRPGYRWLEEHAGGRARYFEDSETWEKRDQYCPSYVVGEGRAAFLAEVKKVYERLLEPHPHASILWIDWEETVWHGQGADGGPGSWCFCDRCKEGFRQWAGLPEDTDLSDAAIFRNYKSQWETFRAGLDAQVAGVARQAANELGRPLMLYTWYHYAKLWTALKDHIDLAFPGLPGNLAGKATSQKSMDHLMAMFREKLDFRRARVMGQEFAQLWQIRSPREFLNDPPIHEYQDPKLQKRMILRIVATFGLGVDLCTSLERTGGMLYWIGEATRILAEYEDLFHEGERNDALAVCDTLAYPDVLVLTRGGERLVLLFNEGRQPLTVTLKNLELQPGQTATVFGTGLRTDPPAEMTLTLPGEDVAVVHIR